MSGQLVLVAGASPSSEPQEDCNRCDKRSELLRIAEVCAPEETVRGADACALDESYHDRMCADCCADCCSACCSASCAACRANDW
eukprot:scaffold237098_cov33-Tisochrysis_lutea.AAC.3